MPPCLALGRRVHVVVARETGAARGGMVKWVGRPVAHLVAGGTVIGGLEMAAVLAFSRWVLVVMAREAGTANPVVVEE